MLGGEEVIKEVECSDPKSCVDDEEVMDVDLPVGATGRKSYVQSKGSRLSKVPQQMDISKFFNCPQKRQKPEADEEKTPDLNIDHNPDKKPKKNTDVEVTEVVDNLTSSSSDGLMPMEVPPPSQPCSFCKQYLDDPKLKVFIGDPPNANDEFITLADPSLSLLGNDQESAIDDIPQHKITDFSVYDQNKHLCPFDTGLVEKNIELYFSGVVKPIYDENPDPSDGIPTKQLGPINSWWIAGFDGGEKALVGFTTAYAEYILMEASIDYAAIMSSVQEKIYLSKIVIEYLEDFPAATYEDLLNKIETAVPPQSIGCTSFSEDSLLRHAQFVVEQVESYDQYCDEDEDILLVSPCMRALIKLAGVTLGKKASGRRSNRQTKQKKKPTCTKATTTPLVHNVFEMFFKNQIDNKATSAPRRRRCGVCEICQQPDCGKCNACKDMIKFGGSGRSKQACVNRRCPNMAIQEAEEDEIDPDIKNARTLKSPTKKVNEEKKIKTKVEFLNEPVWVDGNRKYHCEVLINKKKVSVYDVVSVCPEIPDDPLYIARIMAMWEENGKKLFHGWWFHRSQDTVLGETGDPHELFEVDQCDNNPLGAIIDKVEVTYYNDWYMKENEEFWKQIELEDEKVFFCQKHYDVETARFEDLVSCMDFVSESCYMKQKVCCTSCDRQKSAELAKKPIPVDQIEDSANKQVLYKCFTFHHKTYSVGESVYLEPNSYNFFLKNGCLSVKKQKKDDVYDEAKYPEKYRKMSDYVKGSNSDAPQPFQIGQILQIFTKSSHKLVEDATVFIKVRMFYRPQDTHKDEKAVEQCDLNLLYWSDVETNLAADLVCGKCSVKFVEDIEDIDSYFKQNADSFYFTESYCAKTEQFEDVPLLARTKGKGKGKGKGKKCSISQSSVDKVSQPKLKSLDVFAGCGGLSEGFHQAGVSETLWAIEKDEPAAQAFRLNYRNAIVFTDDCNTLLKMVMEGAKTDDKGQSLPQKGDVELLCGGPPCQGFSGMNRFNSREYSQFKCSFGVLQAGQYGVPQTRRRAIIMAAAPGEKLPNFPNPTHVFSPRACQLSVVVNDMKYESSIILNSAPFRTITVKDSMSDLPDIRNGSAVHTMNYNGEPHCHYQRLMRGDQHQPILLDHICKEMNPLVAARMRYIPIVPGADWRDLPNITVRLSDGTYCPPLRYTHNDKKNGRGKNKSLRGVCSCAEGKQCDPAYRQYGTLIPWCLPHTGNRHNHWAGLYGRLEWDGFFSTTVTNPEPMGKQGRVLHPEQHRVVSVRECARSQGFPDTFRFFGSILDKHRQVGNAVPPPLAKALGFEIKKCIMKI